MLSDILILTALDKLLANINFLSGKVYFSILSEKLEIHLVFVLCITFEREMFFLEKKLFLITCPNQ